MAGLEWIKMSLNVMLVLQFTAVPGQELVVRDGSEATLPCGNVRDHQGKCVGTTWTVIESIYSFEDLVVLGQTQSDRLSLTENCSLVLMNVSHGDVGLYHCRQVDTSGRQQVSTVSLSVVTMTEDDDGENMTLNCSVSSYGDCKGKALWLYKSNPVDKGHRDMKTSQSGCSATVSFLKTHYISESLDNFRCEVTGSSSGNKYQFTFSPRSPGRKSSASENNLSVTVGMETQAPAANSTNTDGTWWSIIAMASAAFILTVVVLFIIRRKKRRNKGKTAKDKAEDNISYVSITLPPSSNNTVHGGNDTVTYSLASAPSDDPPHVYATIN